MCEGACTKVQCVYKWCVRECVYNGCVYRGFSKGCEGVCSVWEDVCRGCGVYKGCERCA